VVSGVSTPENLLNPICVYVLAHFRAVKLLSNWAAIGVEIKYTFSESMVEIYIILMKSFGARGGLRFCRYRYMYKNKSEKDQQIYIKHITD